MLLVQVAPSKVSCSWRISQSSGDEDVSRYFSSLDLLLNVLPTPTDEGLDITDATGTVLETLVRRTCFAVQGKANTQAAVIKVLLVARDGYLCRSDILNMRMRHAELVDKVISFAAWGSHLLSPSADDKPNLVQLLQSSPGALLAKQSTLDHHETLERLQEDLEMRLSFDWVLPTKPTARQVAVVSGRPMCDPKQGMYGSQGFFEAAQALGISLIVIDEPGHWLEGEKYAHLRDEFIAMDMLNFEALPKRLAEVLEGRPIDGIVTFTDEYVEITAEAAETLGLPTEPAGPMQQAHYKHEMRALINQTNIQVVRLDSVEQLDDPAFAETYRTLQYPLVIKPCRGRLSLGVKKVTDEASMRQAARMLAEDGLTEHGILLETYIDGPELDANFVLWDGKVLFVEVCDNFPCLGDASGATLADNFAETVLISNSGLPSEEAEIFSSSLHQNLLQLGFRSGVFHVEGRMRNSSMQYQDVQGDGILDLVVRSSDGDTSTPPPEAFLIEVNVRPPGTGGTWATLFTYGVDMGALQFLRAIDDHERFEALSKPFAFPRASPGGGGGAQYWTAHSMIPVHREKIHVPHDFFEKVYQILPGIIPYVTRAELYAKPGTVVSPSGGIGWIGYFLLYSRTSRRHVLEMYHLVAEASKKVLDAELDADSGYGS
ncbi:glutathione synthetase ATP-binding domain-like protein [Stipitochalara longipes BDJ]|nr:glutathione synthetase ATP-binding domain-like protein [Stipitochalara longipes BDJ]